MDGNIDLLGLKSWIRSQIRPQFEKHVSCEKYSNCRRRRQQAVAFEFKCSHCGELNVARPANFLDLRWRFVFNDAVDQTK